LAVPIISMLAASVILATSQLGDAPTQSPNVARGIAAYERGDFPTALAIFKPIVYDVPLTRTPWGDPWATVYLAQMFRRGQGPLPDWPLSCALFNNVLGYLHMYGVEKDWADRFPFVTDGIKEVCLPEQAHEMNALRSSCYLDGLTRREFVLDHGAWVVFDRLGFHIDLAGEHRDLGLTMACHEVMITMTESDVSIPDGSSDRRVHFLDFFKWKSGIDATDGRIIRHLQWVLYQIKGVELTVATAQTLWTVVDSPYPSTDVPEGLREAVTLRVNAAGDVEWLVRTTPVKRGIIRKR
jgi:hypothetical protein